MPLTCECSKLEEKSESSESAVFEEETMKSERVMNAEMPMLLERTELIENPISRECAGGKRDFFRNGACCDYGEAGLL